MADAQTITREFTVANKYGIHARPAALLVKAAAKFSCEILIGKAGEQVSAKSIMGLLTIEGHHGAKMTVSTFGDDAQEAMDKMAELFKNKFFED